MIISTEIIISCINLGLIYSLVVLGVYLSSTVLKFDDLTTEGSFSAGGALAAILLTQGIPNGLSMPLVIIIGAAIGLVTGFLHTKLGLNNLMSGLVVSTALFSINLKLAGANLVVDSGHSLIQVGNSINAMIILALISIAVIGLVALLLRTEVGFLLRAVGSNPRMVCLLGKRVDGYKMAGLAIANSIIALAGMLSVHFTGFFSITGSIGILVIALAGLMIGQIMCKQSLIGVVVGALIYQLIIATTIAVNIDPTWNKLITAVLIVMLISIKMIKRK